MKKRIDRKERKKMRNKNIYIYEWNLGGKKKKNTKKKKKNKKKKKSLIKRIYKFSLI